MIWWVFALAVLTILSYLLDVGVLSFLQNLRVPFLNASILSILILLCMVGLLGRVLRMRKKGEKEILEKRMHELEKELKALKEEEK
ncbi:MAG: hypothetical protein ACE5WD_09155 [Candidatus Aminicenantia bacterium]